MAPTRAPERRRRLIHRALPLGFLALVALGMGLAVGAAFESGAARAARDFGLAWERDDFEAMHGLLSPASATRYTPDDLRSAYTAAARTATIEDVVVGEPEEVDNEVALPVRVRTRIFGTLRGKLRLPVATERIDWRPRLVFPGLKDGERLARDVKVPRRAKIVSTDGGVLAEGPAQARGSPEGGVGASVAGGVEPSDDDEIRDEIYERGFPKDTPIGTNGLERALQTSVEGRPGGMLRAGGRVLVRSRPRPAEPVRTTIDTGMQAAADAALAGRFGGIAVLDPRTAEVRALAGIAFSAPQPPGSTFKIITASAGLEGRVVKPSDKFPVVSEATIDGVPLENANGELCGGSFVKSFAHSCNSVFAPLGVKVGAKRLVGEAERFGFNEQPAIPGAAPSTIPTAGSMASPLEVGSSAIGQGRVLATPLQMASVAQTIANGGVRLPPTLLPTRTLDGMRATSRATARQIERMMVAVVSYGTGTAAALPGIRVAGKTGTAELEDTRGTKSEQETDEPTDEEPSNTDAWFTSYAPVKRPRVVVSVLLVRNGAGGDTAAPAAHDVLSAALDG